MRADATSCVIVIYYTCLLACLHACMHVCATSTCMHNIFTETKMRVRARARTCTHTRLRIHACATVRISDLLQCAYPEWASARIHTYTHTHIHTYTHTHIHTCDVRICTATERARVDMRVYMRAHLGILSVCMHLHARRRRHMRTLACICTGG